MMVTHDLHVLRDLCSKVGVLANHQLIAFDTLDNILSGQHPFIKQFFHNHRAQRVFNSLETIDG